MPPQVQIGPIVKVTKTDEEWKKQLPVAAYRVLRHEDTERPFVNPLHENHQSGIYYCAAVRPSALFIRAQVRQSHRLAQLLAADRSARDRNSNRFHPLRAQNRSPLCTM